MDTSLWARWGEGLGNAYLGYSMFLMSGCLGLHLALLALYVRIASTSPRPRLQLVLELFYGLVNPGIYLLVFEPALLRTDSSGGLRGLSWGLLGAYWGLRFFGSLSAHSREELRRPGGLLLTACMGWILAMGLKDLFLMRFWLVTTAGVLVLAVGPLYLFPFTIAALQRRATRDRERWAHFQGLLFSPALSRKLAGGCLLGGLVLAGTEFWRPSEEDTRQQLLAHRTEIFSAAALSHVEPGLIASLIFVSQREHTTPFRSRLEALVVNAWLVDPTCHAFLSAALDPSLGLAQLKPQTLMTALWLLPAQRPLLDRKQYRDIAAGQEAFEHVRSELPRDLRPPRFLGAGGKSELVQALLDPGHNIALSAFLLDVYATQWETARAEWSIRHRPEILATLYQIGFQHSHPKAAPEANAFGRRVLETLEDPWMREHFGTSPERLW